MHYLYGLTNGPSLTHFFQLPEGKKGADPPPFLSQLPPPLDRKSFHNGAMKNLLKMPLEI